MTRRKSFYVALMLLLCVWAIPASAGPIVTVASPGLVTLGNSFTVNITITGAVDLYAFQFDLGFDPTLLQATSATEGAFLPSGGATFFIPGTIDNTAGIISATADTLVGFVPGVNGNGDLVDIGFTTVGTGTSPLTLANEIFLDSNLNDITGTLTFTAGTVTVSLVPEPATLTLMGLSLLSLGASRRPRS